MQVKIGIVKLCYIAASCCLLLESTRGA